MALFSVWLGAQQAGGSISTQDAATCFLTGSLCHKGHKSGLVGRPIAVFSIVKQDFFCRRQTGMVLVDDAKTLLEQESQVITLCVAKEMRSIAQPNINNHIYGGTTELADKGSE
jgi:hypothetical protein